jgi:hypothetical protein
VQWGEELVGADVRRREQRETIDELRVVEQGLGRVDRGHRGIDPAAELEPLGQGPGAEDVAQLTLQLTIAPGVVGVSRAGPALEEVHPADAFTEVLPEGLLRRHEEDVPGVGRLVDLVANPLDHPPGAGGPALVVVGLVPGHL